MKVSDFDFELPAERIALHPVEPRDSARMLQVRPGEPLVDGTVTDLLTLLEPGDVLVVNDTRVLPAELSGTRIRGDLRARSPSTSTSASMLTPGVPSPARPRSCTSSTASRWATTKASAPPSPARVRRVR